MEIANFIGSIEKLTGDEPFFAGVPDSLLKPLCDYLVTRYGTEGNRHIVAANEGNAVAVAAGHYLATGNVPVVYMQNSGEGNIVNPAASLLNERVYAIPVFFVVGWRGEPGVHDEPQHIYQGMVTLKLLEDLEIQPFVLDKNTTEEEFASFIDIAKQRAAEGRSSAVVVRKGALQNDVPAKYGNACTLVREEILRVIVDACGDDPVISTTGKASRELFEIREARKEGHGRDFLTVGSMGHSSSIALGVALEKPHTRVWCVDGDGAALMHMGAMAVIGARKPSNLIHIVINNAAHETVGGMPTAMGKADLCKIAEGCGYPCVLRAETYAQLTKALETAKKGGKLSFIEVRCGVGSRPDLGRPTTTSIQNRRDFVDHLKTKR